MAVANAQAQEIVLVLCHSFFHDAFRTQSQVDAKVYKAWKSSRFVANFIIERQAELPEGSQFATTSQIVFNSFSTKFLDGKPSPKLREIVEILHNSIYVVEHPSVNKVSLDDSVFVICDTLFSRSNFTPILVSNIPFQKWKWQRLFIIKETLH